MRTQFSDIHIAALQAIGLPCSTDAFFEDDESYEDYGRAIEREMLGPGLNEDGDLNEYGEALRSCLDVIADAEYELYGPPDFETMLSERDRRDQANQS